MKKLWQCYKCGDWCEEKELSEIRFYRNFEGGGEDYEATCKKCQKENKSVSEEKE